jgi:hypothetical protein
MAIVSGSGSTPLALSEQVITTGGGPNSPSASFETTVNGALVTHPFAVSAARRTLTFAGTNFTVPAGAAKFSVQFSDWPGSGSGVSLEVTYLLTASHPVTSVHAAAAEHHQTLWTVFLAGSLAVRVVTFDVAVLTNPAGGATVTVAAEVDPSNDHAVLFRFAFPSFGGGLDYDPTVFLASTKATATATTSAGDSSWSPGIAAAVAVPLGLAVAAAAAAGLVLAVRRRMGRPRPAVQRRASSVTTQFSMMHSSANDMYDPSKLRELNQLNWQTA